MDPTIGLLGPGESLEQHWLGVEGLLLNGKVYANNILILITQAQVTSNKNLEGLQENFAHLVGDPAGPYGKVAHFTVAHETVRKAHREARRVQSQVLALGQVVHDWRRRVLNGITCKRNFSRENTTTFLHSTHRGFLRRCPSRRSL